MKRQAGALRWLLSAGAVGMLAIAGAGATSQAYLQLTGSAQGSIFGSVVSPPGVDKHIEVSELHHLVHMDPGAPRAVHEPFIFTKAIDRSTVNLYRALDTSEPLTAIFKYFRVNQTGQSVLFYKITLTNARVSAIEPIKLDTLAPSSASYPDQERIRMTYDEMTVEYTAEDNESQTLTAN